MGFPPRQETTLGARQLEPGPLSGSQDCLLQQSHESFNLLYKPKSNEVSPGGSQAASQGQVRSCRSDTISTGSRQLFWHSFL